MTSSMARRTALAAWIGSALEYYDFFIYGTAAALVFNKVFFPATAPATGTLLALATFGVGYLARPLGAFVLGHVGDRFGRKKVLVFTLLLMGIATFAVGCLPTYASVGVLAPVLLVVLRLLQGLSASGEQAGANSMSLEHAPEHRRAYFTSFTLSGTQAGQILATAVFLPVAALPQDDLLTWGWRVPFWCSAVVVVVGLVIRRRIDETAAFKRAKAAKLPVVTLFRNHWADVLRVVLAASVASVSTIFSVYSLSYGVNTIGLSRTSMLWVGVLANVVALAAIPLLAGLSDRIGRKPVFLAGCGGCAILIFPYLWSISIGAYGLVLALGILMSGVAYSAINGIWPSLYGEMFSTEVRLSGMAIGTQFGFLLAGFAPSVVSAIGSGRDGWTAVAIFTAAVCAMSAAAISTARETFRRPTAELGQPVRERLAPAAVQQA
ncbi:MFS transporter [Lentzea sp. NPDC004782]|uniref:MFS transporter n=1 Tax=Lentzea sp. NPDC004782 TaxID=3154458 RepID=UPI0033B78F15